MQELPAHQGSQDVVERDREKEKKRQCLLLWLQELPTHQGCQEVGVHGYRHQLGVHYNQINSSAVRQEVLTHYNMIWVETFWTDSTVQSHSMKPLNVVRFSIGYVL